jgi:hypothetical protein
LARIVDVPEQFPDWSKIPVTLQHQFFEFAEQEAENAKRKLLADAAKLKALARRLRFKAASESDVWEDWTVACVDGSDSPTLSERVGARYGTFAAGYMLFQHGELKDEDYRSGYVSHGQVGDSEVSKKLLDLHTVKLERQLALELVSKADLVLIDGSFFGWRAGCSQIRDEPFPLGMSRAYARVGDLIDEIRDLTIQLLDSQKAVGVIKRVRTAAIDGWLSLTEGEQGCLDRNDRAILGRLMAARTWFAYHWLFQPPEAYNYYAYVRRILREYPNLDRDSALRKAKDSFEGSVRSDLNCNPQHVLRTARYYQRTTDAALPFCFETHAEMRGLEDVVSYFQTLGNYNEATGLPFPIDLIDQNVSLPGGFTREFVEEIEAQLVRDPDLDKADLSNSFGRLNPQKEE